MRYSVDDLLNLFFKYILISNVLYNKLAEQVYCKSLLIHLFWEHTGEVGGLYVSREQMFGI